MGNHTLLIYIAFCLKEYDYKVMVQLRKVNVYEKAWNLDLDSLNLSL